MKCGLNRGWLSAGLIGVTAAIAMAEPPRYRVEVLSDLAPVVPGEYRSKGITHFGDGDAALGWAGSGGGHFSPVRWDGGTPSLLALPAGWTSGYAFGQDAAGRIAGEVYDSPEYSSSRAVIWRDGVASVLPDLGGPRAGAHAVNIHGAIVGYAQTPGGFSHATVWSSDPSSGTTELPILPGHDTSQATDINDAGLIAGVSFREDAWVTTERAIVWSGGAATELPMPVEAERAAAIKINNHGAVLGWWANDITTGEVHSLLWRDGAMVDNATLRTPGLQLWDLNDSEIAVGAVLGDDWTGVLYENGVLYDLSDWVEGGWVITHANAIGDDGRIYASAQLDGEYAELVLVPIPSPATMALLGLAILVRRRSTR